MDKSAAPWWQVFIDEIGKLPPAQQTGRLARLAMEMKARGEQQAATVQALRAWRLAREHGVDDDSVSAALRAVTPRYHVQIPTDAQRIAAWQAALTEVLKPGMLALEVGAGSGILAMLAARTGADVVSCENDPVLAAIAQDNVERNKLTTKIKIIGKAVSDLRVPQDMPRHADVLILDVFADRLFNFRPFDIIRAALPLLRPGAVIVPMQVSLMAALAEFKRWHRLVPGQVAGLDLGALRGLASLEANLDPADPDLVLRSPAGPMVRAALPSDMPAESGAVARTFVCDGGPVNGLAVWLRLDLTREHVLEARPRLAPRGFYAKTSFFAFAEPLTTGAGQPCPVRLRWEDNAFKVERASR